MTSFSLFDTPVSKKKTKADNTEIVSGLDLKKRRALVAAPTLLAEMGAGIGAYGASHTILTAVGKKAAQLSAKAAARAGLATTVAAASGPLAAITAPLGAAYTAAGYAGMAAMPVVAARTPKYAQQLAEKDSARQETRDKKAVALLEEYQVASLDELPERVKSDEDLFGVDEQGKKVALQPGEVYKAEGVFGRKRVMPVEEWYVNQVPAEMVKSFSIKDPMSYLDTLAGALIKAIDYDPALALLEETGANEKIMHSVSSVADKLLRPAANVVAGVNPQSPLFDELNPGVDEAVRENTAGLWNRLGYKSPESTE